MVLIKRFKRRVPSGRVAVRYKREKISAAKCAVCKAPLHGVPRLYSSEMRKLSKTEKRPSRAYGGYLCNRCTKELFRERVRSL